MLILIVGTIYGHTRPSKWDEFGYHESRALLTSGEVWELILGMLAADDPSHARRLIHNFKGDFN